MRSVKDIFLIELSYVKADSMPFTKYSHNTPKYIGKFYQHCVGPMSRV
jgi:hypothetical protein